MRRPGIRFNAFIGGYRDISGLFTETTGKPSWDREEVCSLLPATRYTHAALLYIRYVHVCTCTLECTSKEERQRELGGEIAILITIDRPRVRIEHKDAWRSPCSREISFGFEKEYFTKRGVQYSKILNISSDKILYCPMQFKKK